VKAQGDVKLQHQITTLAALPPTSHPENNPPLPTEQESWWTPELVLTFWRKGNLLYLPGTKQWLLIHSAHSPVSILTTASQPLANKQASSCKVLLNLQYIFKVAALHFNTHCSKSVKKCPSNHFPHHSRGCGGPQHWPSRSPDLTPLNYYL
jgi:hypothetical protein